MACSLNEFKKSKEYLLCVDSDGCAMDTMNIKHIKCFGPKFVKAFKITNNTQAVLDRWNEINLYQITRGINRFKGLAQILCELYPKDAEYAAFKEWTDSAKELSEDAVKKRIAEGGGNVYKKALAWSQMTNVAIKSLPNKDKRAFKGVYKALSRASKIFDIAVVSSANFVAVKEEWELCNLLDLTDCMTTQQDGSKAHCIAELIKKGYDPSKVVMVGDAVGDLQAAEENGVSFYPILVNNEVESWQKICDVLEGFVNGQKIDFTEEFLKNFI
ncbi:MAG: HAD hydrolase-like protein [Roseburia sp.]|nr:HAD hydrolase-like protein [Roseburia sp.]